MTNYQRFANALATLVGATLNTKQLEVIAGEAGLKLSNLFPAACSVTSLDGPVNENRAPSSAPYPVLFLSKVRGSFTVLAPEQQYWPKTSGSSRNRESTEQAVATIAALRKQIAEMQAAKSETPSE